MKIKEMKKLSSGFVTSMPSKPTARSRQPLPISSARVRNSNSRTARSQNSSRGDRNAVSSSSKNSWTAKLWRMFPHSASQQ